MIDDLPLINADTRPSALDIARRLLTEKGEVTADDIKDLKDYDWGVPRQDFWVFRQRMHPDLITGWWPKQIARHLQNFYKDLIAGKRPKLLISAPPQHGKSMAITDFIAWVAGRNPDLKTIFASYSDGLGQRTSNELRRILEHDNYIKIFGRTRIGLPGWKQTEELIEYSDFRGSFRYTTMMGAVTGLELHLGVIDDPVKGRQEAFSKIIRERTWEWYSNDFGTRAHKDAGLLCIATRWHVDDLMGRLIDKYPDLQVLRYPAIAEEDGEFRKKGEALFPEWKPLSFLLEQKNTQSDASWQALYQQNPIIVGAGVLPIDKIQCMPQWLGATNKDIVASVRFWDKAGTAKESASYTAGVLMHKLKDGRFVISHVARGQWVALDREKQIKLWAETDKKIYKNYQVGVEQEPGSGGKESAEATVRNLAGFRVFVDKVTGDKENRADPFAAQVQGGNLWLVAGDWVHAYLDEASVYPQGKLDQIDASSGAFNRLVGSSTFNPDWSAWR